MTRARVLADYVAGGTTAAEFDHMDGVTSNVQTQLNDKAPLASPAFTGTPTGITAAHLEAGVLPSDVTGGSGLTALGTVTTGNLSNTAIVYPAGHVIQTKVFQLAQYTTDETWTIPEKVSGYPSSGTGMQTVVFNSTNIEITGITATAGNKLLIACGGINMHQAANDGTYQWDLGFLVDGVGYVCNQVFFRKADSSILPCTPYLVFTVPASFSNKTISMAAAQQYYSAGTHDLRLAARGNYMSLGLNINMSVQEIQV